MKKSISQKGKRYQFDVLVIGSGIAGLNYILDLLKLKPNCKIALITKKTLPDSNSFYAQGGIAAANSPKDSIQQHVEDTLKAGDNLCNKKAVEKILAAGQKAIERLEARGIRFDLNDLAREGGHTHRRIYHSGDKTGKEIIRSLLAEIKKQPQVKTFEFHAAINLITQNREHVPASQPEVIGAYVLEEANNKIHAFLSNCVVLATGGAGKIYRYTSNLGVATGDGIAMAYRAGARLGNLEFYQFHPTLLYNVNINNFLISEALRGEGAYLRNADTKKRFMEKYAADKMELATRDIVARAIFNEIENSKQPFVYLDIRRKKHPFLKKRFPLIFNTLMDIGIDISKDFIPIIPAAHYLCGGILTDTSGQTDIKRLYAIGETAFTGLHGANRLASNSLLEGVVMANFAAQHSADWIGKPIKLLQRIQDWNSKGIIDSRRASQIHAHWSGLRSEMTSYAGIIRTKDGLKDLLKLIEDRRQMIEDYYWKYSITKDLIELRNITLVASLIVRSAIQRKESRGGHYREDYPKKFRRKEETIIKSTEIELFLK